MTKAEEKIQELTRFGAGAVDELLFGLPEYVLKNLGKREDVEKWISKAPRTYKAGEVAGTVGSMFLPFGLLGKTAKAGTAAAALKALPEVATAKRAVDWGKIASLAGRGSLAGGLESGVRNITSESETPFLEALKSGALWGAGGGIAGGLLAEKLPQIAKWAKKQTEKAVLGTTDARTRDLLGAVQKMSGPGSGAGYQSTKVDAIRSDISDFVKKNKLWKEGAVEKAYQKNKAVWKQLDDTFESVAGNKPASEFLKGVLDQADLADLTAKYDAETVKKAVEQVMNTVGPKTGLPRTRESLDKIIQYARKATPDKLPDQQFADALGDIAGRVRNNLDEAVINLAESQGAKIPPNFKKEWGLLQPIAKGEVRSEITPSKFNLGSPTWEKAVAGSLIGGVGTGAMTPGDIEDRLKMGVEGAILGGLGTKAISAGLTRAVGKADTLAGKLRSIAPAIAEAPGLGAIAGGRAAADVVNAAAKEAKPKTEEQAQAADIGAEGGKVEVTGQPEAYLKNVDNRINEFWATSGAEQMYPGQLQVFKMILAQMTDNFNPEKTAGILFPMKDEREKFLKAYQVSKRLTASFALAEKAPTGILDSALDLFSDEATKTEQAAARADILGVLTEALDRAKSPDAAKTAKKILAEIASSPGTTQDKRKMLEDTLSRFGLDFGTLRTAGVA